VSPLSGHVPAFALALHELATDAASSGTLKEAAGRLSIAGSVERASGGDQNLIPTWQETGIDMPPFENLHQGYAHRLIGGTKAKPGFGADGISCRIGTPLEAGTIRNTVRPA
jgi:hypothetical protein